MGNSYGQRSLGSVGRTIQLLANNAGTRWKAGALTIDWSTVTAAPAAVALEDGVLVASGTKYLRYGQVVTEIAATGYYGPYNSGGAGGLAVLARSKSFIINETVLEADSDSNHPGGLEAGRVWRARLLVGTATGGYAAVVAIDATGGNFKLVYNAQTTADIPYNATAAQVLAALEALSTIGVGEVSVVQNGSAYTVNWNPAVAAVVVPPITSAAGTAPLTGGAGTATVTALALAANVPTTAVFEAAFPDIKYAQ